MDVSSRVCTMCGSLSLREERFVPAQGALAASACKTQGALIHLPLPQDPDLTILLEVLKRDRIISWLFTFLLAMTASRALRNERNQIHSRIRKLAALR